MLTLIEGGFTSLAHEELNKRIADRVATGGRCYLIVPEQQTVTAEGEACTILPPEASLCFEVTNFTRFTNTAFRTLGGIGGEYCDSTRKSLLLWRAIYELSPSLNMTRGRSDVGSGFVGRAMSAINEIQGMGIDPDTLARIAEQKDALGPRLADKLGDMSRIFSLYKQLLRERYSDTDEDCAILSDMLANDGSFLNGVEIFIDGFTSFTEPQYRLLRQLIRHADVTVTLTLPKVGRESSEFYELRDTERRLLRLADAVMADKRIVKPDAPSQGREPMIGRVADLLFRSQGALTLTEAIEAKKVISVYEGETPYEACDFIASDIKRRVMDGERYGDFAIVARQASDYLGILDTSLTKTDIPHFISKSKDIESFEAIKLIYTAYAVIKSGFRREDVITYAKCGLTGLGRDEVDLLELYCEKWNISGSSFTGDDWAMNPRGYAEYSQRDIKRLAELNFIRQRLIDPILKLRDSSSGKHSINEHILALYEYLGEVKLEEKLLSRAKELADAGDLSGAEENSRLYGLIIDSMDVVTEVLGQTQVDRTSFINQLAVVFSAIGIGRIPAHQDEVTVGSADMLRLVGKKRVYLLGVNAGEFPRGIKDNAYFTAKDRSRLYALGIDAESNVETKNSKELYSFARAFTFATRSVTLLYSIRSRDFKPQKPASVIERLEKISSGSIKRQKIRDLPLEMRLYSPEIALEMRGQMNADAFFEVRSALSEIGYRQSFDIADADTQNTNMKLTDRSLGLVYNGELYLSQTKIDKFVSCPMNYFCTYVLGLKPQERAELDKRSMGSFIHSILENFFKHTTENDIVAEDLEDEDIRRITERASRGFIDGILGQGHSSAVSQMAIDRLCRVATPVVKSVCHELNGSSFRPVFFELPIKNGDPEGPDPIVFTTRDGGKALIEGVVDRVDRFLHNGDVYVRVMDYKTGSAEVNLKKIQEGQSLQMLLYLKAITESESFKTKLGASENGKVLPAGVVYIGCDVKDAKIDRDDEELASEAVRANQTRDGMLLTDQASIDAMNPEFMPQDKPTKRYSIDEWKTISKTVEEVVLNITEGIKGGDSKATQCNKCEWCGFAPICRNQKKRNY